jgi:hypothetical protein
MAMQNVKMEVKGNKLMIECDLTKDCGVSKSGKSVIIATTGGNVEVPGKPEVILGLNLYTKA